MFKSPITHLEELIKDLVKDFSNMAFEWLELFMFKPTLFSDYPYINGAYTLIFAFSMSLGGLFFAYNLFTILMQNMSGNRSKNISEVLTKTILASAFAAMVPYLLDKVLIGFNNAIVKTFINMGINVDLLAEYVTTPATATTAIVFTTGIITILFVILSIQYIKRIGELLILYIFGTIAAFSLINDEMNVWPIWWREAFCVVFQQSFQVIILWITLNQLGDAEKLSDYWVAVGLMSVVISGPTFLRRYLYSTGSGRAMVGAAGGATKMAIYKMAAKKITAR
jgi:hypothetical protein